MNQLLIVAGGECCDTCRWNRRILSTSEYNLVQAIGKINLRILALSTVFKRTPVNGFLILSIFFYVLTYHQEHQKTLKLVCKEELIFLILLQIISPVESDVILEDIPERTTTANSSVEEEVVDDQEDDQSGKSVN